MSSTVAVCTGCGITSDKDGSYDKDNPVQDDGTYRDGKFVCNSCYMQLTMMGRDIGTAEQLQFRASMLKHTVTP